MKIPCSSCNQRLEIPEELAGQTIECPACNASLAVPYKDASPTAPPRVHVATPSASQQPKPASQRTAATQPKASSSKKSKPRIPKWAIVTVACLVVGILALILVSTNGTKNGSEKNLTKITSERRSMQTKSKPFGSLSNLSKMKSDAKKLSAAIENNDLKGVENLLNDGVDPSDPLPFRNASSPELPLRQAISLGNKEITELLIDYGVDVNGKFSFFGETALHEAAYKHRKEIVELLIAKGANVNAKSKNELAGITPLDSVYKGSGPRGRVLSPSVLDKKRAGIAEVLRKHGGKTGEELKAEGKSTEPIAEAATPEPTTAKASDISIHDAAFNGFIEDVKQHLNAGEDVDAKGGWMDGTPLQYATMAGHKEIVELLIADGADVNAKVASGSYQGKTQLDLAIMQGRHETADLLRKHGGKTGEELKAEQN
jgi:ankyrin repeat protein